MAALAKRLHIPIPHAVGIMEMLWHFTAEFAPTGDIGKFDNSRIAASVCWTRRPAEVLIGALVDVGWLDSDPQVECTCRASVSQVSCICATPRLLVHDWCKHADRQVYDRCKNQGLSFIKLAGKTAPALALALAKPQPATAPASTAIHIGDRTAEEWAERWYARHPKKRNRSLVEQVVVRLVMNPDKAIGRASVKTAAELFALIDRAHGILSVAHDWTKDGARYCPKLDEWLTDEGYRGVEIPATKSSGNLDASDEYDLAKARYEEEIRNGTLTEYWDPVCLTDAKEAGR